MAKRRFAESDFKNNSLPSTRKEMFGDVFRMYFFRFMMMGLLLLAFAIPCLAIIAIRDYSYIAAHQNETNNAFFLILMTAIEIPCICLFTFPLSGFGQVIREYIWLEPVFFWADFKSGVKKNWKPTLISLIIIGLLNLLFEAIYVTSDNGFIVAIPFGFNLALFLPAIYHTIYLNFIYSNSYYKNLKFGAFCYFKHIPSTMGFLLLLSCYKLLDLFHFANIISIAIKLLILLIFIVFFVPFILLGGYLNEMRIFDIHINSVRFPDYVNKGLRVEKDEKETN